MNVRVLFVLVAIGLCGLIAFGALADMVRPRVIDPSQDSINMVQPYGWWPARDSVYAGDVNVPNSEANANNAEANYLNAQATAVVMEQYKVEAERNGDMALGGGLAAVLCMLGFVLFGGAFLALGSKLTGG